MLKALNLGTTHQRIRLVVFTLILVLLTLAFFASTTGVALAVPATSQS